MRDVSFSSFFFFSTGCYVLRKANEIRDLL